MEAKHDLVSAIICTRNRSHQILAAVRSVLDNEDDNFELVVIDQSDDNASADALVPVMNDARLRYFYTTRVGLSAAYNAAVQESAGALLAFTDDDCLAPIDWIGTIRREFESDSDADLIYGEVHSPPEFGDVPGVIPVLHFESRKRLTTVGAASVIGMGANFALRRSAFEELGGFDELLGGGGPLRSSQDFDFQYRLLNTAGHACVLSPSLYVIHYGHRTPSEWNKTLLAYGVGDGAFYMKHLRCGDFRAGAILWGRIWHEIVRVALKPLIRRKQSRAYLVGLLQGSVKSFGFKINRRQRLYLPS